MFSTYDMTEFGKTLRQARNNCRLTQSDVKRLAMIHEDTLRKLENGTNIPKYETLEILSSLYKVDLLELLKSKRMDERIYDYYHRMDKILVSYNLEELELLYSEFNSPNTRNSMMKHLLNRDEMVPLNLFIQCCKLLHTQSEDRFKETNQLLETFISKPTLDFNELSLEHNAFNDIEIRLLFMYGTVQMDLGYYDQSISILAFVIQYLSTTLSYSDHTTKVILKAYTNLSYSHHLIDQHENALKFANEGIDFALKNNSFYMMAHLYGRKAVAEYFLNSKDHIDSFTKCIHLFEISKQFEMAKLYKSICKDKYGIELD